MASEREDDDDDDIAELFSFGSGDFDAGAADAAVPGVGAGGSPSTAGGASAGGGGDNSGGVPGSLSGSPGQQDGGGGNRDRSDSFVEFLEAQGGGSGGGGSPLAAALSPGAKQKAGVALDEETQELLEWLDHNENDEKKNKEESSPATPSPPPPSKGGGSPRRKSGASSAAAPAPAPPPSEPTVVSLPPLFKTLAEALESPESTVQQIRKLGVSELQQQQPSTSSQSLTPQQRAELYSRLLTNGKQRWSDVCGGSLAESFLDFCGDPSKSGGGGSSEQEEEGYFVQQNRDLAVQIAACHNAGVPEADQHEVRDCQDGINKLLSYHYTQQQQQNQRKSVIGDPLEAAEAAEADQATGTGESQSTSAEDQGDKQELPTTRDDSNEDAAAVVDIDPLLPPAAAALLAALTHPSLNRENPSALLAAASVLWQRLLGTRMPLLPLPQDERWEAICTLHLDFYLLSTYHLPLLANHLDRYLPGWYWPKRFSCCTASAGAQQQPEQDVKSSITEKSRHLQQQGKIAPSWLVTSAAGQCSHLSTILYLWDKLFLDTNNSMAFFLLLALLEQQADKLLLLTGDALQTALEQALIFPDLNQESNDDTDSSNALQSFVSDWWSRARSLKAQTPATVLGTLQTVEDKALQLVLKQRQERAQAALNSRLEAEREAHRQAQEAKAQAARDRLTRARLVVFYRKHCPDKEGNIDRIMETYAGRYDVLDNKLKLKYGEGFNPAVKPKPPALSKNANKLLSTMNQGLGATGRQKSHDEDDHHDETQAQEGSDSASSEQVSVLVAVSEVLPVVCWTREAAAARGQQRRRRLADQPQLKFYLIDSRSNEAVYEQGRFPTAIHLSPEHLMDPEHLEKMEERFESLRGAVHIVVMGEGFAALPSLYPDYKINPKLEQLMQQDESQTNICALFFVKKGFPFVSVLNGGFCAAHSWLVRQGPSHHLSASQVIVDYDPDASLFGQLETLHNASSATEKAQHKMQFMMDKSMAAMTKRALQLERFADRLDGRGDVGGRQKSSLKVADLGMKKTFSGIRNSFSMDSVDLNEPAAEKKEKPTANEAQAETTPDAAAPSGAAASKASDGPEKPSTEQEPAERSSAPSAAAQNNNNRFTAASGMLKGWGTAINQYKQQHAPAPTGSGHSSISAASSGSARDWKQQQQSMGNVMKRNPFARFGGGGGATKSGGAAANNPSGGGAAAAGFGGLNQFRRTALARVRSSGGPAPPANSIATTAMARARSSGFVPPAEEEEVSISFASNEETSAGDSSNGGGTGAPPAATATMVTMPPLPPASSNSTSPATTTSPPKKNPAEVERV